MSRLEERLIATADWQPPEASGWEADRRERLYILSRQQEYWELR